MVSANRVRDTEKKPIIFVTDDTKEDWWRLNKEGRILGPRPELIQEIYEKANIKFYMYLADEFIKRAQEFLDVQIQPGTIEEARDVRQSQQDLRARSELYHALAHYYLTHKRSLPNILVTKWLSGIPLESNLSDIYPFFQNLHVFLPDANSALLHQALLEQLQKQDNEEEKQNSEDQDDNKAGTEDQIEDDSESK